MRRWNGWGDDSNDYPLKPAGLEYIRNTLGEGRPLEDASLESVLAKVPGSRLPEHPLISQDPELRVRHARGQSLPDWLAMRSGEFDVFPDGVAQPENNEQLRDILAWVNQQDVQLIIYGGGTSVAGHINPPKVDKPVLTLSLAKLDKLIALDTKSQVATFGAGTPGPALEAQLKEKGYVLGHFPQSWELSTVGGWVASRSSGQQSMRYGRIEQMFAGGTMELLDGQTLELADIPASSAGPDLREWVMGSEGRMGVISDVKVRVTPLPEHESFHVAFAPNWDTAVTLVRSMVQAKLPLSMLRLSNANETRTHLILAGHENLVGLLNKYLSWRGQPDGGKCMITFGCTGSNEQAAFALKQAKKFIGQSGGVYVGKSLGRKWEDARFRSPYLRHGLWDHGYVVDTLETCVNWDKVPQMVAEIETAINDHAGTGETAHVFTHLSHLYSQGSSIYTTYVFRCSESYEQTLARWREMKKAASDVIASVGGTISHQHGVGRDHAPWLKHEKTEQGIAVIQSVVDHFDPQKKLNPGCLLEDS